jgi:glycosyltransferase involved in cell wall biosynthesis
MGPLPTLADYVGTRRVRFPTGAAASPARISVITICLNAASTISRAIASIHAQRAVDFEHVVVDGGSTDGTLELVRGALRSGDFLLSEPDRGISDALNKGIALAAGEFVQFVHSDDWLAPDQLAIALAAIEQTSAEFVFGDLRFYERERPSFRYVGEPNYAAIIDRRMPNLNHPTVLARRTCFEWIGLFDLRYRCAMDYDWFLRLHRAGGRGAYVPAICGNMNRDGVSNRQFVRTAREVAQIAVAHGRPAPLAYGRMTFQIGKIAAGRVIDRHAKPLYRLIRRQLNPSYQPVD